MAPKSAPLTSKVQNGSPYQLDAAQVSFAENFMVWMQDER
jgi:hypothetical protein